MRPHDASRRHARKLCLALEFTSEGVSIRVGGAAFDVPVKIGAGMARGAFPRPVIGHRTFDGKKPLIMVRDDEEELPGWLGIGWGSSPTTLRGGLVMWQPPVGLIGSRSGTTLAGGGRGTSHRHVASRFALSGVDRDVEIAPRAPDRD